MTTRNSSTNTAAFPEQFARTRRFSLGVPRQFTVSPDGRRVLFVRTGSGSDPVGRLWQYEAGEERLLADPALLVGGGAEDVPEEERLRRERARERSVGVVGYATDAAVRVVAFALSGALWVVRTDGGAPFSVPAAGPVVDPRPSPDGRCVAYVSGRSLYVVGLDGGDRKLAGAEGPEVSYGLAEYVAAESMGRSRGYWWAPDGRRLLVARVDTSPVARRYLSDPADPSRPPQVIRYPSAGTANAEVTLHLLTLDGVRTELSWDRAAYEYVVDAGWDAHGPFVAVQSRDQRVVRTLAVNPESGATEVRHERTDPAWVELVPGTPSRTASGALVLPEDADGTRRLTVGGRRVTPDGLQLAAVLGVEGERVLFTASDDPVETHVWCHEPGAGCRRLSWDPGVWTGTGGGGTTVLAGLTPHGHQVHVLRDDDAPAAQGPTSVPAQRPAHDSARSSSHEPAHGPAHEPAHEPARRHPEAIASLAEEPVIVPRPMHLSLGKRELRAALYFPSWHQPGSTRLPVLLDPYGGPGMQLAVRARSWTGCVSQWFAEQGFAVLVADGRGTPGRGPVWEKAVHGDQLGPALEDQVDAVRAAGERFPDLDLGRVAVRGWSFGGFLAAAAVLHRPDVFHAAVAGAPPTDQRMYDTHWKERFLGHPDEHPENYARSSLAGHGHLLRRPLMLIHGLADDNVAAAHTLRFSAELLAAGRPHTVLPLPGATHMPADDAVNANLLRVQRDFLKDALPAPGGATAAR
ncbi:MULTISPECIES: prolyl oligopeptidase family serine peptidase [unclassified Streptomyces]|uniref:prolyl oligopeptidase family serine peptidase n=1 Tax=Streptomyces sp. SID8354 TaxID=2690339 RepID=UPI000478084B|nr:MULTISPECIES: prolyl oligopeptidase family serine peptidase [unclassified Streptomyces]MYT33863.1 prolyl oligopeptidase family serine peptidase [Streptomyces sp. SID8354]